MNIIELNSRIRKQSIEQGICIIDHAFTDDFCDKILEHFYSSQSLWYQGATQGTIGTGDKESKDTMELQVESNGVFSNMKRSL